ncbi:hypothetical protein Tco_0741686 [Tanacetum coccineum]
MMLDLVLRWRCSGVCDESGCLAEDVDGRTRWIGVVGGSRWMCRGGGGGPVVVGDGVGVDVVWVGDDVDEDGDNGGGLKVA